jgi:hypothetical protein
VSFYERLIARRIAAGRAKRAPCRRCYDGAGCVLEPLHDDWHKDTLGRRWP